jgi:hypothetical protein
MEFRPEAARVARVASARCGECIERRGGVLLASKAGGIFTMRRRQMSAVTCLLIVVTPLLLARRVSASPVCDSSLPLNIDAGALEPQAIELLQRSTTFRQQCERIAATAVLRVTLQVGMAVEPGGRAQTIIRRYDAGGIRAEVILRFGEDYFELLAHEFEHILEQVEGVSLPHEVAARRAWITPNGAFETRRASDAGVRARQEFEMLAVESVHVDGRKPPAARHPFD